MAGLSEKKLIEQVKSKPVPQHVAIIMDGNGRWAKLHGFARSIGHRYGVEKVIELLRTAKEIGVKYVTVYAFSTENWNRPKEEVEGLMELMVEFIHREIANIKAEGARICVLGDISVLPERSRKAVEFAVEDTAQNTLLQFNVALNYGARAELVRAVKTIVQKVQQGELTAEAIDEAVISDHLYTAGLPDPDLIIRTAGEMRLSNFLLYQCAYSELWVSDSNLYWPDFNRSCFLKAIYDFQNRERRFGGLKSDGTGKA